MQDGASKMASEMMSLDVIWQIWYHLEDQAQGFLINVNCLNRLREGGVRVSIHFPLYHGVNMSQFTARQKIYKKVRLQAFHQSYP